MSQTYDEFYSPKTGRRYAMGQGRSGAWDDPNLYRDRLLELHEQEKEKARGIYESSGGSELLQAAYARGLAAEQGAAYGARGGMDAYRALGATAAGTLDATARGQLAAQGARQGALSAQMGVEARRAGYEQAVAESHLARAGASEEAQARIRAARQATEARLREMYQRIAGGALGAISAGMASGAEYGATQGGGTYQPSIYGDQDQPGPYYGK